MCDNQIMRPEHPSPQMVRESWKNLNGQWDFLFDFGISGEERKFYLEENFDRRPVGRSTSPSARKAACPALNM